MSDAEERLAVLDAYRKKMRELRELEARLKANRESVKEMEKEFDETENNLKSLQVRVNGRRLADYALAVRGGPGLTRRLFAQLQMIGQIIGEVLKQLDDTRFIVKVGTSPCPSLPRGRSLLVGATVFEPLDPSLSLACAVPATLSPLLGVVGATLRGRVQGQAEQGQDEARRPCRA